MLFLSAVQEIGQIFSTRHTGVKESIQGEVPGAHVLRRSDLFPLVRHLLTSSQPALPNFFMFTRSVAFM